MNNHLFEKVADQKLAVKLLVSSLKNNRIAPGYIFSGPKGSGRKLAALRFLEGLIHAGSSELTTRRKLEAKNHPDLMWVEPSYIHQGKIIYKSIAEKNKHNKKSLAQIRLEQIREITRFISTKPLEAKLGMVIIEEIETMNESASNALLKTLEEPGENIFILITERPEKIPETVISRCQIIPFIRLKNESIIKALKEINENSLIHEDNIPEEVELIELCNGSTVSLLENIAIMKEIPDEMWPQLKALPQTPVELLTIAKNITENLDMETQIWLINWLQQNIWLKKLDSRSIKRLEKLRLHLVGFVQPKLAWEVALLDLGMEQKN